MAARFCPSCGVATGEQTAAPAPKERVARPGRKRALAKSPAATRAKSAEPAAAVASPTSSETAEVASDDIEDSGFVRLTEEIFPIAWLAMLFAVAYIGVYFAVDTLGGPNYLPGPGWF